MAYLESNEPLMPAQFGFRRGKNTKHDVRTYFRHIRESLNIGMNVAGIILDV